MDKFTILILAVVGALWLKGRSSSPEADCSDMKVGKYRATKMHILGWSPDGKRMHVDYNGSGTWKNSKEVNLSKSEQRQLADWIECVEMAGGYAANRWAKYHPKIGSA